MSHENRPLVKSAAFSEDVLDRVLAQAGAVGVAGEGVSEGSCGEVSGAGSGAEDAASRGREADKDKERQ